MIMSWSSMENRWKVSTNHIFKRDIVKSYMRIYQRMPNIGAFFQAASIPDRPYIESKHLRNFKVLEKGTYVTKKILKV